MGEWVKIGTHAWLREDTASRKLLLFVTVSEGGKKEKMSE